MTDKTWQTLKLGAEIKAARITLTISDEEAKEILSALDQKEDDTTSWEYDKVTGLHICKKCGMSELWRAKFCPSCGRRAVSE